MVTKYFEDMPSGDSQWTEEGHRVVKEFMKITRDYIDSQEADGPVHIRELEFLMGYAVRGATTEVSLERRVGVGSMGKDEQDNFEFKAPEANFKSMREVLQATYIDKR